MMTKTNHKQFGFTIVELLIVIVIIAILAVLSVVAYNGIQHRARTSEAITGLSQAKRKLELYKVDNGNYPTTGNLSSAGVADRDVSYQYTSDGTSYCLTGAAGDVAYNVTHATAPSSGVCSGHTTPSEGGGPSPIQAITSANCPSSRTMTVDARDNRTYWVQKLADGKCWMLTNLAYAGGGTNTYNDTKSITQSSSTSSYTVPYYYISSGAAPTTSPTQPSTSTSGNGQYGYHYNWCAAMGVQSGTNACANATTPASNPSTSICPADWRLPTSSEFMALNAAINGGSSSSDAGLRSIWLGQLSAYWAASFSEQGTVGMYWASTQINASSADTLLFWSSTVRTSNHPKNFAATIRCVAS